MAGDRHTPPPHTLHAAAPDGATFEGDTPDVLAAHLIHPSARPTLDGKRSASWRDVLTGHAEQQEEANRQGQGVGSGEGEPLIPSSNGTGGTRPGGGGKRRERSESKHRRREELPWHKRPSPVWFIPGTLAIALSMGMTIAPKLSIYTTLVCRALPPERSGVTVPPPILATDPPPHNLSTPALELRAFHPASGEGPILFEWVAAPPSALSNSPQYKISDFSSSVPNDANDEKEKEKTRKDQALEKEWNRQCAKSSAVQSEVASLALVLSLLMGILSSMTTGFWGSLSDRRGRRPVLVLALLGTVLMDAVFLLTVNYHQVLSYNFLLLGPILDGLLGGYSTAQATSSAYLSDVTPSGSRARIFSLIGGLMYAGIAIGPLLGSFLISLSGGNQLAPFYASLVLHAGYLVVAGLFLPESLEKERQYDARRRYVEEGEKEKKRRHDEAEKARSSGQRGAYLLHRMTEVVVTPFSFLKPVAMLLPRRIGGKTPQVQTGGQGAGAREGTEEDEDSRPNIDWGAGLDEYSHPEDVWKQQDGDGQGEKGGRRNWTLTLVAASWTAYMMLVAVMSTKLLYTAKTFGWTSIENGYFLTFLGASRVVTMVIVLPLFIRRVLGRREAPLPIWEKPVWVEGAGGQTEEEVREKVERWERERKWLKTVHESHFDHVLALSSLALDLVAFLLYTLAPLLGPRTPTSHLALFLLSASLQSLGSGATPALQSLALAHSSPRDAGRLFASLSVLQSLASQVVGPAVFGVTFMRTVGKWSEAIFALASALTAISLAALGGVRLRRVYVPKREEEAKVSVVGARTAAARPGLGPRGRSATPREDRTVRPAESGISLRTQAGEE
ncbi:hypothetical protein JCM11251_001943 [Rhodosporidiobolus azoricus]